MIQENDLTNTVWASYYSEGFFGYGPKGDFKLYSTAHFLPIILAVLIIILIHRYRNQLRSYKYRDHIEWFLIFIMLFAEMSFWCRLSYVGPGDPNIHTMMTKLPLQVCQYTLFITVFAIISKSDGLFSMAFYLTTLPTYLAIIIVEVLSTTGPGYFRYYQFWLEHLVPLISVYYLMFVHNKKPNRRHVGRTMTFLSVLYYISYKADVFVPEGENLYMYVNFVQKIPFFKDYNMLGLYFVLLFAFGTFFVLAYYVYAFLAKRNNYEKKR